VAVVAVAGSDIDYCLVPLADDTERLPKRLPETAGTAPASRCDRIVTTPVVRHAFFRLVRKVARTVACVVARHGHTPIGVAASSRTQRTTRLGFFDPQ